MEFFDIIKTSISDFLAQIINTVASFLESINLDKGLSFLCDYHLLLCSIIFIALLVYFIVFDKKKSYIEFTDRINVAIFLACIPVYSFLSDKPLSLNFLGLGSIPIHPFLLIILGKYYGPLMTATFSGLEYFLTYIDNPDTQLLFSMFFAYAIGGFIHGWILYEQKTSFWRCFLARLIAIFVCNILLLSIIKTGAGQAPDLNSSIASSAISSLIQLPFQAVSGYISLILVKMIRDKIEF